MQYFGSAPYKAVCASDGEIRYFVSDFRPDLNSPACRKAHDEIIAEQRFRDRLPSMG